MTRLGMGVHVPRGPAYSESRATRREHLLAELYKKWNFWPTLEYRKPDAVAGFVSGYYEGLSSGLRVQFKPHSNSERTNGKILVTASRENLEEMHYRSHADASDDMKNPISAHLADVGISRVFERGSPDTFQFAQRLEFGAHAYRVELKVVPHEIFVRAYQLHHAGEKPRTYFSEYATVLAAEYRDAESVAAGAGADEEVTF